MTTNDPDSPLFVVQITGEVIEAVPAIVVRDGYWNEVDDATGSIDVGATTTGRPLIQRLTIQNEGTATLLLDEGSLTLPAGFSLLSPLPGELAPFGGQKTIYVQLDAATAGNYSGTLSVSTNDPGIGTFDFTISGEVTSPDGPISVADLALLYDTGPSAFDKTTFVPILTGSVTGDFGPDTVYVEFDHDGDLVPDGAAHVLASGEWFTYDPRDVDAAFAEATGAITVKYRTVAVDSLGAPTSTSSWSDFDFTLEAAPVSAWLPVVGLMNDTGQSGWDLVTADPTLSGVVPGANVENYPIIEFDLDGDMLADASTSLTNSGQFVYRPEGLGPGEVTILARALEWRDNFATYLEGAWVPFTFTLVGVDVPPDVQELGLVNDTGADPTDGVSSDATLALAGRLHPDTGDPSYVEVALHLDTAQPAVATTWTDVAGNFEYRLTGLSEGPVTVWTRTVRRDHVAEQDVYGSWSSFTFTYEPPGVPTIAELTLLDASEEPDSQSLYPTLTGQISGEGDLAAAFVAFDHDGDLLAEGYAITDVDGRFEYFAAGLIAGSEVTIEAWISVWDDNLGTYVNGAPAWITFTVDATPSGVPATATLSLQSDTGEDAFDLVTTDSTIAGQITNDGSLAHLQVELRHGTTGSAVGSLPVSADGQFTYRPQGLLPGPVTIQARVRGWDYAAETYVLGDWSTPLDFTLEASVNSAPAIDFIGLWSDSGVSDSDEQTANAMVWGRVSDGQNVAGVLVEFAHGDTNDVDGVTFTNADGEFYYQPEPLQYGAVDLYARAVEWDANIGSYLQSAWSLLDFDDEEQAKNPSVVVDLALDGVTVGGAMSQPIVSGRILNEGPLGGIAIQLDYDGDEIADESTRTDRLGRFRIVPSGLASGSITIGVRAVEIDAISKDVLDHGDWTSMSPFTYGEPAVQVAAVATLGLEDFTEVGGQYFTPTPIVVGTITSEAESLGSILIEFDHNGGGLVDGSTTTDGEGQFAYGPGGLEPGEVTLRARVKQYGLDAEPLPGAWTSLDFVLEESPPASLSIAQFVLANDTGTSSTDGATSDPTVTGQITGPGSVDAVTVQLDYDGNGVSDATAATDSQGEFSYGMPSLGEGIVTVRARTVESQSGVDVTSEWATLRFVYSNAPDSYEAQSVIFAMALHDADWQTAELQFNGDLDTADLAYQQAINSAVTFYEDEAAIGNVARRMLTESSLGAYSSSVTNAEAGYLGRSQCSPRRV